MSQIRVDSIKSQSGTGAVDFPNGITVTGVITATNLSQSVSDFIISGIATIANARVTNLNVSGISTFVGLATHTGTVFGSNLSLTGIATASTFVGTLIKVGTAVTFNSSGINVTGVITATSFVGDGGGLTGAGSTVADDIVTNQTFYPVFTQTTSGTITASKVSTTKLNFNPSTGILTVVDLNSTSDINLKENIKTIENAVDTIESLRGVSFDWKETGRSSYGVIAQELEEVLPELVKQGEVKSVNYNGIIGVLIEAIKELKKEIEDLKNTK